MYQEYVFDQATVNGFDIKIVQDEGASNPRDDYTHGCELALSHSRYDLPDDGGYAARYDDLADLEAALRADFDVVYQEVVYGYDHGALVLKAGQRTGQFADPWDSGVAGLAYVTRQNWKDTQGTDWTGSDEQVAQASRLIAGDLDDYNHWALGEVCGYTITDPVDGEVIDSCWGFMSSDEAMEEAKGVAEATEHAVKCNGTLNRLTGKVDHAGPCPLHDQPDGTSGQDRESYVPACPACGSTEPDCKPGCSAVPPPEIL